MGRVDGRTTYPTPFVWRHKLTLVGRLIELLKVGTGQHP